MTTRPYDLAAMDYDAIRLRRRRRLWKWSLPAMVICLVIAMKLIGFGAVSLIGGSQYRSGSYQSAEQTYGVNLIVNIMQPHLTLFAHGTAALQAGDYESAERNLNAALAAAPSDFVCSVRANLALVYERQADKLVADHDDTAAVVAYSRASEMALGDGCTQPKSDANSADAKARDQARQTEQRASDKSDQAKKRSNGDKESSDGSEQPSTQPSESTPTEDQIKRLQESQDEAQRQRSQDAANDSERKMDYQTRKEDQVYW